MNRSLDHGFTLLETMISLSIIAIALTVLLTSQSQSLSLGGEAKFITTASLLAQDKMAEIEAMDVKELMSDSGDFGDDFPGYRWEIESNQAPVLDSENLNKYLKQINLNVFFGGDSRYKYTLRLYRFVLEDSL
jgi:general secretion pathway protein I